MKHRKMMILEKEESEQTTTLNREYLKTYKYGKETTEKGHRKHLTKENSEKEKVEKGQF